MTQDGKNRVAVIAALIVEAISGQDREELLAVMMRAGEAGLPCWREIESLAQMLENKAKE